MIAKNIDVIYWDLGGVLVNDNVETALKDFGVEYGAQQIAAWQPAKLGYVTVNEFLTAALHGTGLESRLTEVAQRAKDYLRIKEAGVLPFVRQLQGNVRHGIISNHTSEWGRYAMHDLGLQQYFDPSLVIISADVHLAKPDQAIFDYAIKLASAEPKRILFVDNQDKNVIAARQGTKDRSGINAEVFKDKADLSRALAGYGLKVAA
ncbi:HAD hydrolase-like protein [Candidatus Woesearchaeota archaeon]|nr:HAD hydrolase-like protein [Candidatus Woesearchaeota archaeon]